MNDRSPWMGAALAALLVIPTQTLLFPALLPAPWVPHVGLLVVFLLGMAMGETLGVVSGLVIGLIYDRYTGGGVGIHMFLLPCVGAAAAAWRRLMPEMGLLVQVAALLFVVTAAEVCTVIVFSMAGVVSLDGWLLLHRLLPGVVSDLLLGSLLLTVSGLNRRLLLP